MNHSVMIRCKVAISCQNRFRTLGGQRGRPGAARPGLPSHGGGDGDGNVSESEQERVKMAAAEAEGAVSVLELVLDAHATSTEPVTWQNTDIRPTLV